MTPEKFLRLNGEDVRDAALCALEQTDAGEREKFLEIMRQRVRSIEAFFRNEYTACPCPPATPPAPVVDPPLPEFAA